MPSPFHRGELAREVALASVSGPHRREIARELSPVTERDHEPADVPQELDRGRVAVVPLRPEERLDLALVDGDRVGRMISFTPAGTPFCCSFHVSSLPTKSSLDSLCSRICRTVPAASVGYSGTDTWPAIQIAKSLNSQWAEFLASSAMREPGSSCRLFRWAAMRRVWSSTSRQV